MCIESAISAAFGQPWLIGRGATSATPCRYRFKEGKHLLKTFDGVLDKGTPATSPAGVDYEVVNSERVDTRTYQHTLQLLVSEPDSARLVFER